MWWNFLQIFRKTKSFSCFFLFCQFSGVPDLEFFPFRTFPFTSPFPPNHMHQPHWLVQRSRELINAHVLPCIKTPRTSVTGYLFLDSLPLKMGPIGCPETSVRNYHYLVRSNREGRSYQISPKLPSVPIDNGHCTSLKFGNIRQSSLGEVAGVTFEHWGTGRLRE
jgi:hypothetical protein